MAAALSFNNIRAVGRDEQGQFRAMGDLFGWKSKVPGRKVIQHEASAVSCAEWHKVTPRESQLRFTLKSGESVRFDGFRDTDFDALQKHFANNTPISLSRLKYATKGWHWGEYDISDKDFVFKVDGTRAFSIHIPNVHWVNNPIKNDVSLEFSLENEENEGNPIKESDDNLLEVRFALPPSQSGGPSDENAEGAADPTTSLREMLLEKSGARQWSTDAICQLSDVKVAVPSARFDINIMKTFMKLHGKSNDFIVPFKTVQRMFLLPEPTSVYLVLSLDTPLRKGNTRHHSIIIQFDERKSIDLTLNLSDTEISEIQRDHPNVERRMAGREYDVLSRIFKAFVGRPVIVPKDFKSSSGQSCIGCSNKAASGSLYPLGKMLVFIPKPLIILKYEDILSVEFGRTSGSQTRLFEFKVAVKGGSEYEFSSVDRQEYQPLLDHLQKNGIKARNLGPQEAAPGVAKSFLNEDLESDDSDEDFEANPEEMEDGSTSGESEEDDEEDEEEASPSPKAKAKSPKRNNPSKPTKSKKRHKPGTPSSAGGGRSPDAAGSSSGVTMSPPPPAKKTQT